MNVTEGKNYTVRTIFSFKKSHFGWIDKRYLNRKVEILKKNSILSLSDCIYLGVSVLFLLDFIYPGRPET